MKRESSADLCSTQLGRDAELDSTQSVVIGTRLRYCEPGTTAEQVWIVRAIVDKNLIIYKLETNDPIMTTFKKIFLDELKRMFDRGAISYVK